MAEGRRNARQWAGLAILLVLAAALRFYRLDAQSLWNDEGTSVALAGRDLATITRSAALDIHPPLYYYLLHAWAGIFGSSEFAVRSLSALAGVGVVAVTWALGRRLFGPIEGLLAGLFAALSAFQVYYAQEARMYIFVTLLGGLSMLAQLRLLECWALPERSRRPPARAALAYVVATTLATYTHYFAFSLVAGQNVVFLIWLLGQPRASRDNMWRRLLGWLGLEVIVVLLYVPWLIASWGSLRNWPAVSAPVAFGELLARVTEVYALGVTIIGSDLARSVAVLASLPALAALSSGVAAWRCKDRQRVFGVAMAAVYAVVPPLVMYILSLSRPMYKAKFVLLATPGYHLLIAAGIVAIAAWMARTVRNSHLRSPAAFLLTGGIVLASGWSLHALYTDPRTYRDDYRAIVEYIGATAGPSDAILINAPGQYETVAYYYQGPLPMIPLPLQRPIDAEAARATLDDMLAAHNRIYAILWATNESDPNGVIEGYLDQRAFKTLDSWFGNVRLAVYATADAAPQGPLREIGATFGDAIALRGYRLQADEVASGDILRVALEWSCLAPVSEAYKVFVHLVDARGNIVGQQDGEPGGGSQPTTGWRAGEVIVDNHGLLIPPGSPPGAHTLRIGLYSAADGRRLPVSGGEDALDLSVVTVTAPKTPAPVGALDMEHAADARWGGLSLVGYSLHRLGAEHEPVLTLRAGDVMRLVLFWRREEGAPPGDHWVATLHDGRGRVAWEQAFRVVGGDYPPEAWQPGELVRDVQALPLATGLPSGTYRLAVAPAGEADRPCYLGSIRLQP